MISERFKELRKHNLTGFVPYLVANYPNKDIFDEALAALSNMGADLIEIGIPFTDPIAEGKTIETAHHASLKNGFDLTNFLKQIKNFKNRFDTHIVAMGYANSFLNPSIEEVSQKSREAGFDGFLIVDMPYEETDTFKSIKGRDLEFIQLVAPTSTQENIKKGLSNNPSLIYYITQRGVTGASNLDLTEVQNNLKDLQKITNVPIITGFGIKSSEHIKAFKDYTDGIVIGSALIECLANSNPIKSMKDFLAPILEELKNE